MGSLKNGRSLTESYIRPPRTRMRHVDQDILAPRHLHQIGSIRNVIDIPVPRSDPRAADQPAGQSSVDSVREDQISVTAAGFRSTPDSVERGTCRPNACAILDGVVSGLQRARHALAAAGRARLSQLPPRPPTAPRPGRRESRHRPRQRDLSRWNGRLDRTRARVTAPPCALGSAHDRIDLTHDVDAERLERDEVRNLPRRATRVNR